jgi:hypothetical protein
MLLAAPTGQMYLHPNISIKSEGTTMSTIKRRSAIPVASARGDAIYTSKNRIIYFIDLNNLSGRKFLAIAYPFILSTLLHFTANSLTNPKGHK